MTRFLLYCSHSFEAFGVKAVSSSISLYAMSQTEFLQYSLNLTQYLIVVLAFFNLMFILL